MNENPELFWSAYRADDYNYTDWRDDGSYRRLATWRVFLAWLWLRARIAYCERFGHKLVDESWAGPDSGGMAARCDRCGWHFETILY